jgi:DNA modification methylase
MTIVIKGKDWKIYQGDTRESLAAMPEKSVQCCITSPPYFGLRDYKTAKWEGGDPNCDHIESRGASEKNTLGGTGVPRPQTGAASVGQTMQYKYECKKCGAIRQDMQIGLEPLHDCLAWARQEPPCGGCYVCTMRAVFGAVWRVLRDDGTLWLNLGDSYARDPKKGRSGSGKNVDYCGTDENSSTRGCDTKLRNGNLIGIPWRVALALQADGWVLRSEIIWHKRTAMPESVKNRCTKAHEQVFMFAKGPGYYYDAVAIQEEFADERMGNPNGGGNYAKNCPHPDGVKAQSGLEKGVWNEDGLVTGKNKRSVWSITSAGEKAAHFAPFPPKLIEPMILAGTSEHGCCAQCGTPYRRLVEREQLTRERPNEYVKRTGEEGTGNSCANTVAGVSIKTVGWQAGCACNAAIVPCVILDPFLGSGTSVAEALKHHRRGIGCELNPEYVEICKAKIEKGRLNRGFF